LSAKPLIQSPFEDVPWRLLWISEFILDTSAGELSRGQVSELLDLEVNETMGFLKEHGCAQSITIEEFEREAKAIRELLAR
jgi:predicted HTH domain antitoxin